MKQQAREYYLMHKDIRVCLMEITEDGSIGNVRRNEAASEHFPLGGQMNNMKFHEWWRDRAIPKTRHGYWIQPRGENLAWKDINLFANDFVDSFGEITINRDHMIDLRKETRFNCATSQGSEIVL